MKITAEPRSDQWNADDFVGGSRVFTVAGVRPGSAEQKYDIDLVEGGGRCWRPPLTVLRLLIAAWGDDASAWAGRRVELFRDESITFGRDAVGGIRVAALSHIDKPLTVALTATRGKRAKHTVQPLTDAPPTVDIAQVHIDAINATGTLDALIAAWNAAGQAGVAANPDVKAAKDARKAELMEAAQ